MQFADPGAGLAVLRELEERRRHREAGLRRGHAGEPLAHADRIGQLVAARGLRARLVVEQIHLRGRAGLEQIDDAFGLWRKVRQTRQSRAAAACVESVSADWPAPQCRVRCGLPKKYRRVEKCRRSMSLLGHRFIQVQDQARDRWCRRPVRAAIQARRRAGASPCATKLRRGLRIGLE